MPTRYQNNGSFMNSTRIFLARRFVACLLSCLLLVWQLGDIPRAHAFIISSAMAAADCTANPEVCDTLQGDIEEANAQTNNGLTEDEARKQAAEMNATLRNGDPVNLDPGTATGEDVNSGYDTASAATLIIAIAAVIAGATWVFSCVNQPSAWIFGLVSIAWLVAEIIMMATSKDASERRLTAITNVSSEMVNIQTEAINKAKEETQAARDQTNTRYIVTSVVAALYVVAAVVALIEGILHVIPTVNYNDVCTGVGLNIPGQDFITPAKAIAKNEKKKQAPVALSKLTFMQKVKMIVNGSIGIESAKADTGDDVYLGLGIVGVVLVIIIGVVTIVQGGLRSGASTNGFARAAIMAVFAGFTIAAAVMIKDKMDTLDARIQKFGELIAALNAGTPQTSVLTGTTSTQTTGGGTNGIAQDDTKYDITGQLAGTCTTGEHKGLNIKADIGCKQTPIKLGQVPELNTQGAVEIPSSVLTGITNSSKFANDLNTGKGVSRDLSKMASKDSMAKLNSIKKSLAKSYEDLLKKQGKTTDSLEKMEGDIRKDLLAKVQTHLQKFSAADRQAVLSHIMGPDLPKDKLSKDLAKSKDLKNSGTASNHMPKNIMPAKFAPVKIDSGKNDTFAQGPKGLLDSADALNNLKYVEKDIDDHVEFSIFDVITNRYRKTAYPIIFERKSKGDKK